MQVTVGDENDNNPTFTNLPNETSVSEGAATNTAFYVVTVCILKFKMTIEHSGSFANYGTAFFVILKAVDADEGLNAFVSYSISSGNTGDAFAMDVNR